jgi:hypothetical protein
VRESSLPVGREERLSSRHFLELRSGSRDHFEIGGLIGALRIPELKGVPPIYSDPEHYWTGFPDQVRLFVYNKNLLVDPDDVPTSVFDMINP